MKEKRPWILVRKTKKCQHCGKKVREREKSIIRQEMLPRGERKMIIKAYLGITPHRHYFCSIFTVHTRLATILNDNSHRLKAESSSNVNPLKVSLFVLCCRLLTLSIVSVGMLVNSRSKFPVSVSPVVCAQRMKGGVKRRSYRASQSIAAKNGCWVSSSTPSLPPNRCDGSLRTYRASNWVSCNA